MSSRLLALFALVLVARSTFGSERTYGISRIAALSALPNMECLRRVIGTTTEVNSVEDLYPTSLGGKLWSYRYDGEGFWANLTVSRKPDGALEFSHERLSINHKPSSAEVKRTLDVMKAIEARLIQECRIRELAAIRQKCIGIDCPPEDGR